MGNDSSKLPHAKSAHTLKMSSSNDRRHHHIFPPAIKVANSMSCSDNLLNADFGQTRRKSSKFSLEFDSSRSRSGSTSSARSTTSRMKHPIAIRNRQLIQSCFQNPHEILGKKIMKRACEKRFEFGLFYLKLDSEQKDSIEENIKILLKKAVANIDFIDEVQRLAEEFGAKHVQYRTQGFKPDFFAICADATITECAFLDNAVHPAHQTLNAFSTFITMVFSSVRDGFYAEMRRMRRTSNSFSIGSNSSFQRKKFSEDLTAADLSPRSISPEGESRSSDECFSGVGTVADDNCFLKPPSSGPMVSTRSS
ncbi:Uncharacterized protein Tcan_11779 [Toxocara canis]|uniref:Uncharacterized protein n=1 Tax=Toxocara canis TaxID=6265 RepID=A0A0B2VDS5_TOXCA|nr:Uncharacterized protein Tcan_11779 [Toxocara canis]